MRSLITLLICIFIALPIASETLTVKVETYKTVSVSGDGDSEVVVDYAQTNNRKSQLTQDNSLSLSIQHLPASAIQAVTLSMKSNKSGGAGSMRLMCGSTLVWSIADGAFAGDAWGGDNSGEYMPISHAFNPAIQAGDIMLTIAASANSLYFESITITYLPIIPVPHTVSFSTGSFISLPRQTETTVGGGIVLPNLANVDPYFFLGWTPEPIAVTDVQPFYYAPQSVYYPKEDVMLYALYCSMPLEPIQTLQDTTCTSGEYAIVALNYESYMAAGAINNHKLEAVPVQTTLTEDQIYSLAADYMPADCRYQIDFQDDSLMITHVASGQTIGYEPSSKHYQLADKDVLWHWEKAKNNTLLLTHDYDAISGMCGLLEFAFSSTLDPIGICDEYMRHNPNWTYLAFFPVSHLAQELPIAHYSSNPTALPVENIASSSSLDWTHPVTVYSLHGQLLFEGITSPSFLPRGIWLVRQSNLWLKVQN